MTLLASLQAIATALADILSKTASVKAALTDLGTFLTTV
jgi:hypothetical protein